MKSAGLTALCVAFLALPQVRADAENPIKGSWQFVSMELPDGKVPDEQIKQTSLSITDDRFTIVFKDKKFAMDLKIDAKAKTIDVTPTEGPKKGKLMRGIFSLKDGTLQICISESDKDRPKEFRADPITKAGLMTLTRAKK